MIATPEGVQVSDISQQGYKKPMTVEQQGLIMMMSPRCRCWYDRRNLTFYCKNTWGFYFAKK